MPHLFHFIEWFSHNSCEHRPRRIKSQRAFQWKLLFVLYIELSSIQSNSLVGNTFNFLFICSWMRLWSFQRFEVFCENNACSHPTIDCKDVVLNDQNDIDKASRIIMFLSLNFENLCFEQRKCCMDCILKRFELVFAKRFLNLIQVLFKQKERDIFFYIIGTLKPAHCFNQVKLFYQAQVNENHVVIGDIVSTFTCCQTIWTYHWIHKFVFVGWTFGFDWKRKICFAILLHFCFAPLLSDWFICAWWK